MNNALSGIERDIILSYLCTEPVGFTLVPEQPAEQIFSFAIGSSGIKMLPEGILLFTDPLILPVELYGKQVEIRFYFKKLGLSFTSVILLPFRVASPIGSHPAIMPALTQWASFPYTIAATLIGTEPVGNIT